VSRGRNYLDDRTAYKLGGQVVTYENMGDYKTGHLTECNLTKGGAGCPGQVKQVSGINLSILRKKFRQKKKKGSDDENRGYNSELEGG